MGTPPGPRVRDVGVAGVAGVGRRRRAIGEGEREYGRVVALKESFGFIRCGGRREGEEEGEEASAGRDGDDGGRRSHHHHQQQRRPSTQQQRERQVFFHASEFHKELAGRDKPGLDPGDLVSFVVGPSPKGDGQLNAFDVQRREETEIRRRALKHDVIGVVRRTLRGKMKRDAYGGRLVYDGESVEEGADADAGPTPEDASVENDRDKGEDESTDIDEEAMKDELEFSGQDLDDACRLSKLKIGVKVKFTLMYDPYSRALRASGIREACPAREVKSDSGVALGADGDDWNRGKVVTEEEFGVISIIKASYGFIKCCSRTKDLFFHFSELTEKPDEARVGREVQFRVTTEPRTNKTVASGVRFAPAGSAVFETVDERRVRGVCKTKLLFVKGFPSKGGAGTAPTPKGVVEEKLAGGETREFTFTRAGLLEAKSNPREGDLVQFCLRTDNRTGLESACKVEIMRFVGKVTSSKSEGLYGVVEHVDPGTGESGRAFVHGAEIEGSSVRLNVGDELEYSLQVGRKPDEFSARRVKVLSAAAADPNAPPPRPDSPRERVNRDSQFSGSQFKITKGPDGTRGFEMGRGKGLAEKAAALFSNLKVGASAFVPLGKSSSDQAVDEVVIQPSAVADAAPENEA